MKQRIRRGVLLCVLCMSMLLAIAVPGFADSSEYVIDRSGDSSAVDIRVYIDSLLTLRAYEIDEKYYICADTFLRYLGFDADVSIDDAETLSIKFDGLDFSCKKKNEFAVANYRYVMVPGGYRFLDGQAYLPLETYQYVLNLDFTVFDSGNKIMVDYSQLQVIKGSESYYWKFNKDDILWLARIIYAEASRQCMEGKIAVGDVVLNRKANSYFPNTIQEIIFDTNNGVQFDTATGGLDFYPTEPSRAAAYMALDGVNLVEDAEYFINQSRSKSTWHKESLTFVIQIGDHTFYADRRE